jgi:fatty acid desaturase
MVGTSVENYRPFHFEHHRSLGTIRDTESSYFHPLNLRFLLKSLLGVRAMEVLFSRRGFSKGASSQTALMPSISMADDSTGDRLDGPTANRAAKRRVLVLGLIVHAVVIMTMAFLGGLGSAAAWIFGILALYPVFNALRQLLEHRRPDADAGVDYRRIDHGAYTRMFGGDALSATFGGAGFNRHLLHHWEPQVSYTKLPELERFLLRTDLRSVIDSRRAGYGETMLRLFRF